MGVEISNGERSAVAGGRGSVDRSGVPGNRSNGGAARTDRPLTPDFDPAAARARITSLHTLGPSGTNCEAAAAHWFEGQGRAGSVVLHKSLEVGVEALFAEPAAAGGDGGVHKHRVNEGAALLGCAVYPDLHELVFRNLDRLAMVDSFVMPTFEMVLAARDDRQQPHVVATHPAPQSLVPDGCKRVLVDSNAAAARTCAAGDVEGCITTSRAAAAHGLTVLWSAGPVPMVFTIHAPRDLMDGKAERAVS